MKKRVLIGLLITICISYLCSCDLFSKEEPDETESMTELSYEQITEDLKNTAEWTKGKWNADIKETKKTKRDENVTSMYLGEYTIELVYYEAIAPAYELSKKDPNSINEETTENGNKKKQYRYTYDLHIFLSQDQKVFITDIITYKLDKKTEITTTITDRYRLEKTE